MARPPASPLALFVLALAAETSAQEATAAAPPEPAPAVPAAPVSQPKASVPPPPPTVLSVVPAAPPTDAIVHVAIDYPNAWLEGRSRVDLDRWQHVCRAPCDRSLRVDGLELRVTAPGMTPSNAFVVDPGGGTARLRVSGGSSSARGLGIAGLATGLPVAFVGMTLFGLGAVEDEQGVRTAGLVTLGIGAAAVLVSLPLLLSGATTVRNERGHYIAERRVGFTF